MARNRYDVIVVVGSTRATLALKAATQTIPVVFMIGSDPVATGLVASLNRPGGNLTGTSVISVEVIAKRFELLHELVPTAKTIALLVNPANGPVAEAETNEMRRAASVLGVRLLVLNASTLAEIETAFAIAFPEQASALVVGADSFFDSYPDQIIALAARYRVPAIYSSPSFNAAGGLLVYGALYTDAYRVVGVYTGRILNGEKPADLPVQQSTRVELSINLKTAKTLGLTVPLTLRALATEVIE
jgi:putative ABC transport system substrate-binding protein